MRAFSSGASSRGLVPIRSRRSSVSIPAMVVLNSQLSRGPAPSFAPSCRQSSDVTPRDENRSIAAFIDSASCRSPAITPTRSGEVARSLPETAANASAQLAALSLPSTRTNGRSSRWRVRPSGM